MLIYSVNILKYSVCIAFQFLLSEELQQSSPLVCVFWSVSSETFEAEFDRLMEVY